MLITEAKGMHHYILLPKDCDENKAIRLIKSVLCQYSNNNTTRVKPIKDLKDAVKNTTVYVLNEQINFKQIEIWKQRLKNK